MCINNGIKEHLLSVLVFGGIMGIPLGLASQNLISYLTYVILIGGAFSVAMLIVTKIYEKRTQPLVEAISRSRKVICHGSANWGRTGGWMIMTELGLEYYSHGFNFEEVETFLPFNMILGTETRFNRLIIYTSNEKIVLVVCKAKEWEKQIAQKL